MERNHLLDAVNYLKRKDQIEQDVYLKLKKRINARFKQIQQYYEPLYRKKQQDIRQTKALIQKQINQKANEMKQKFDSSRSDGQVSRG